MSTLHQLLTAGEDAWRDCKGLLQDGDELLLVDDGVRRLLAPGWRAPVPVLALEADVAARGLQHAARQREIRLVSDAAWVGLLRAHATVLSWK